MAANAVFAALPHARAVSALPASLTTHNHDGLAMADGRVVVVRKALRRSGARTTMGIGEREVLRQREVGLS
jgi:hypothetical protein